MKKYIMVLCAVCMLVHKVAAQCMCSASNSNTTFNDNMTANNQNYNWGLSIGTTNRWFKPMYMPHTVGEVTHHHVMESIALASTQHIAVAYKFKQVNELSMSIPYTFATTNKANTYTGFNDVQLWYNRLIQLNNVQLKAGVGVELPSNLTPTALSSQVILSSGSIDPMLAIRLNYFKNKWIWKFNTIAKYTTTNSSNNNLGNYSYTSATVGYKLNNNTLCESTDSTKQKTTWIVFGGVSNDYFGKQYASKTTLDNTGGDMLLGNAGVSITHKFIALTIQSTLPIHQQWIGEQQNISLGAKATLAINF
ncbi:MAG: hypothetical protein ABL940_11080 [Bacteroidia bacterium]